MPDDTISSAGIRDEFESLIASDLLGPAGGADEMIANQPVPRDRYLVGLLAPKQSYVSPSRFDAATAADPSGATSEDHVASPPQLVPSALGPHVCRSRRYAYRLSSKPHGDAMSRETVADENDEVRPRLAPHAVRWHAYTSTLPRVDGALETQSPDPEFEHVVVSGRVRHRGSAALVTLFLVNEQTAPEQNLDEAWLFQASLAVRAPDVGAIFLDRSTAVAGLAESLDPDEHEARSLAMLYRHAVDFAVGHGVAVHAVPSTAEPTRAVRLETRAMPSYDVARTDPPTSEEIPLLGRRHTRHAHPCERRRR